MKESISYAFILNIVILFVFVCFAVIMGIFSYNRAFRAGTIIIDTIEKYEGYNCLSAAEIDKKLSTISYNLPFDANCNKADKNAQCTTDTKKNYAVVSYNLDYNGGNYMEVYTSLGSETEDEQYKKMNTKYGIDEKGNYVNTKKYQYGVFTYMYIDLPIVSNLLKLSVYSKSDIMHEFRDIIDNNKKNGFDEKLIPQNIRNSNSAIFFIDKFGHQLLNEYADAQTATSDPEYNAREIYQYHPTGDFEKVLASDSGYVQGGFKHYCGYTIDYSKF